jgi:hypothetical protein
MPRRFFSRSGPATPQYYIYLSKTKVEMLYPQIPRRLAGSLEAEVKANIGVMQATVRGGMPPDTSDLYTHAATVARYLEKHDKVGTIDRPERYIKDTATLKYGIIYEYASDIAFFGATIASTKLGLIGSADSMVGAVQRRESQHATFYYTLKFLNRLAEQEAADYPEPDYYSYMQAFDIASSVTSLETRVEFLARLLHQEPGLIIATPIYVAVAE